MYTLRKKLGEINTGVTGHESTWDKICYRQRVGSGDVPSFMFPAVCPIVNKMLEDKNGPNTVCSEGHILELWAVNGTFNSESEKLVNSLTDEVCFGYELKYILNKNVEPLTVINRT